MPGQLKRIAGPAYLAAAAADIYAPPAATIFTLIRQIHLTNTDSAIRTVSLYVGATGGSTGGTEICSGKPIAANDILDLFFAPGLKMLSTDFLSGLASVANKVTIVVIGEQVVA